MIAFLVVILVCSESQSNFSAAATKDADDPINKRQLTPSHTSHSFGSDGKTLLHFLHDQNALKFGLLSRADFIFSAHDAKNFPLQCLHLDSVRNQNL